MSRVDEAIFAQTKHGRTAFDDFLRTLQPKKQAFRDHIRPYLNNVVDVSQIVLWLSAGNGNGLGPPPENVTPDPGLYFVYGPDWMQGDKLWVYLIEESDAPDDNDGFLVPGVYDNYRGWRRQINFYLSKSNKLELSGLDLHTCTSEGHFSLVSPQSTETVYDGEMEDYDKRRNHMMWGFRTVQWSVFLRGVNNVAVQIPRENKKDVRRRVRQRIPSYRMEVVNMGLPPRTYLESGEKRPKDMGKMGTALHRVRGHLRQYKPEMYTWINPHWRGDIRHGYVDKILEARK